MTLGTARIIQGDATHLPLADESVDLVITSPPYFGLRSYQDGGQHYSGQLGDEPTPREYVDNLITATQEMIRVLKPTGSIWVNLGDRYSDGMPLDAVLTVADAGWLAGLIDADGTITVRHTQQPSMRAPTFEGIISVEQMDREAVDRCHAITGRGKVHQVNGSRGRPMYRWTVSTQQARWVAERIWPFLRIKARQAKAIVELGRHREECQARGRYAQIKPEWVQYRRTICDAVRAWNQRDNHPWEPPALPVLELPLRPRFIPAKSLTGIPWRYALRCVDDLGLILRAEIIWSKPNGLPESVTDRVRRSHEVWFHFTKSPRYYSAIDHIREPHKPGQSPAALSFNREGRGTAPGQSVAPHRLGRDDQGLNPLGKLPGSVWEIPTQPLTIPDHLGVDHYAAFPIEWPRRIIQAWSPPGICTQCGQGRRPVASPVNPPTEFVMARDLNATEQAECGRLFSAWMDARGLRFSDLAPLFPSVNGRLTGAVSNWRNGKSVMLPEQADAINAPFGPLPARLMELVNRTGPVPAAPHKDRRPDGRVVPGNTPHAVIDGVGRSLTGYACDCPTPTAPTTPALVLDPFGGTGTTALAAKAHGRHGITLDMSADYNRIATWRCNDPGQLASAMQVDKPPTQHDGQLDLLDGILG